MGGCPSVVGKTSCINRCEFVSSLVIGALSRIKTGAKMGTQIDVAIITVCHRIYH